MSTVHVSSIYVVSKHFDVVSFTEDHKVFIGKYFKEIHSKNDKMLKITFSINSQYSTY